MLADRFNNIIPQSGRLDREIHLPSTVKLELVGFIAEELPRWRNHPDRPAASGETTLTEHLCDYLNSAVHNSSTWSHVQFRTETGDETCGGRKIDLTVKPRAAAFIIEGRRHSQFDALFPIECKRLPTPKGKDRDEREYVTNEPGTTGGIQRFKFGYHGAAHTFAAMIAYVQEQSFPYWMNKINCWIQELAKEMNSDWSTSDVLQLESDDADTKVSTLKSIHLRTDGLGDCELRHLWIKMG
jgi:hypothetical protein